MFSRSFAVLSAIALIYLDIGLPALVVGHQRSILTSIV
jgi:hypothetical protein